MTVLSATMLVVGLMLLIVGAVLAGRNEQDPMMGISVGLVGVFLLTGGGVFGKFAIAGPYPKNLEAEQ